MAASFETDLLRLLCAELYLSLGMQTARELFGKSYFALGAGEKQVVDDMVLRTVGSNYQATTPEWLGTVTQSRSVGFQAGPTPAGRAGDSGSTHSAGGSSPDPSVKP